MMDGDEQKTFPPATLLSYDQCSPCELLRKEKKSHKIKGSGPFTIGEFWGHPPFYHRDVQEKI